MSRPGPSYNSMSWVDTAALFRITMPATRRIFCKCIESKWYYESCFVFWLRYHIFKYPIAIQGDQKPKAGQCTFWNRLPENLQVTSFYKHGSEKKGLNFLGPKVRILKFTYLESSHQIQQLGYKQNLCLFFLFSKKCLQDQCVLERLRC